MDKDELEMLKNLDLLLNLDLVENEDQWLLLEDLEDIDQNKNDDDKNTQESE